MLIPLRVERSSFCQDNRDIHRKLFVIAIRNDKIFTYFFLITSFSAGMQCFYRRLRELLSGFGSIVVSKSDFDIERVVRDDGKMLSQAEQ